MVWLTIFMLALVLLFNRYLLLEPRVPIRIPNWVKQALGYSAPCLLTAICGPILLQGEGVAELLYSPYLYATLLSVLCAYFLKSMLLSVLASLVGFYGLLYFIF